MLFQESIVFFRNLQPQDRTRFKLQNNEDWSFGLTAQYARTHMMALCQNTYDGSVKQMSVEEECVTSPRNAAFEARFVEYADTLTLLAKTTHILTASLSSPNYVANSY